MSQRWIDGNVSMEGWQYSVSGFACEVPYLFPRLSSRGTLSFVTPGTLELWRRKVSVSTTMDSFVHIMHRISTGYPVFKIYGRIWPLWIWLPAWYIGGWGNTCRTQVLSLTFKPCNPGGPGVPSGPGCPSLPHFPARPDTPLGPKLPCNKHTGHWNISSLQVNNT